MNDSLEKIGKYYNFVDEMFECIRSHHAGDGAKDVEMVFYARDHSVSGDVWRNVLLRLKGVREVFYSAKGGQSSVMVSGVRLLSFDELLCIEVDGVYEHDKEPQTIEEIRKYGT
ncbi:hypothetical protein RBH89_10135 [Paracidovorax avenae]